MSVASRLERAALALRTIRHLKPVQWGFYPLRKLQSRLPPPRLADPEEFRRSALPALAHEVLRWGPGDESVRRGVADAICDGRFEFLNHAEHFGSVDWTRPVVSPLWTFHLHYFDYAVDLAWAARLSGDQRYADRFGELAASWITQTASRRGPGWESYVISVRAMNWILGLLVLGSRLPAATRELIRVSLFEQLSHLEQRRELHIQGNHLQRNTTALVLGGLVFDGPVAARWRREFGPAMWRVIEEQVLPDGGHYERSPMYHLVALVDFAQTIALCDAVGERVAPSARRRIGRMLEALPTLRRPDGSFHLFNDCAGGMAAWNPHFESLATALWGCLPSQPAGPAQLPATGYFGYFAPPEGERLLVSCATPAPEYQPGHAHCDLLSFELDVGGRPLVVDSGTSGYDGNPLRDYQRSTPAHNSLTIDSMEQSEFWGTFRVARRARVTEASASHDGGVWTFQGAYIPYHSPDAIHERRIDRSRGSWTITDRARNALGSSIASYLHFHPDVQVTRAGSAFRADCGEMSFLVEPFGFDDASVVRGSAGLAESWYSPQYGQVSESSALVFRLFRNAEGEFGYRIRVVPAS